MWRVRRSFAFRPSRKRSGADESILFQQVLRLVPGKYMVGVTVRDGGSTSESRAQSEFTAPSFGAGSVSAPILAYQATGRGNLADPLNLVLNPRGSVGYGSDTLLAYIEGYRYTKPTTVPFKVVDEQGHVIHQDELRFRGGHEVESQVIRLSPDSVALGELQLVVGEGNAERKVSALVSFTQAWVVTNFDEMLDLLRYFGHDNEVSAMRKAPESERARMWREFYVGHRPQYRDARERGAQPVLRPHRAGQPALHRRGRPRLADRSRRGLHQPRSPRRGRSRTPPAPPPTGCSGGRTQLRLELFFRDESGFGRLGCCPAAGRSTSGLWPDQAAGVKRTGPRPGSARPELQFPLYLSPNAQPHPPAALPHRRLRPDLSRLLRDDLAAAADHQG